MIIRELLTKIGFQVDSSGLNSAMSGISNLGNAVTGLYSGLQLLTGAAQGVATAFAGILKPAMDIERIQTDLTVLLGSFDKAVKLTADINKMAAQTPFETLQLADYTKQLLAFGATEDKVLGYMSQLGDIALGDNEKLKGLSLAFGQVMAKGRLMGEEVLQFTERGFNPLQVISAKTGKSMNQLYDEMAKGQISFQMLADAMKDATSAGGRFYQGMAMGAKTLSGVLSTLRDNFTMAITQLGNALLVPVKALATGATKFLGETLLPFFRDKVAPIIAYTFERILPILDRIGAAITKAFGSAGTGVFAQLAYWLGEGLKALEKFWAVFLQLAPQFIPFLLMTAKLLGDVVMIVLRLAGEIFAAMAPVLKVAYVIVTAFLALVGVLLKKLEPAITAILRLIGKQLKFVMDIFGRIFSMFGGSATGVLDTLLSIVDALVAGIQVFAAILGYMIDFGSGVVDKFFNKIKSIVSAIGSLWSWLKGVVMSTFLAPVVRAMESAFTALFDAIRRQVNRLVGWANKILPDSAKLSGMDSGGGLFSDIYKSLQDSAKAQQGAAPIVNNSANVEVTMPPGTSAKDAKKVGKAVAQEINAAFSIQLSNVLTAAV